MYDNAEKIHRFHSFCFLAMIPKTKSNEESAVRDGLNHNKNQFRVYRQISAKKNMVLWRPLATETYMYLKKMCFIWFIMEENKRARTTIFPLYQSRKQWFIHRNVHHIHDIHHSKIVPSQINNEPIAIKSGIMYFKYHGTVSGIQ